MGALVSSMSVIHSQIFRFIKLYNGNTIFVVLLQTEVFWDVTSFLPLSIYRCLFPVVQEQGRAIQQLDCLTLKTKALRSFQISLTVYQSTQRNTPVYTNLLYKSVFQFKRVQCFAHKTHGLWRISKKSQAMPLRRWKHTEFLHETDNVATQYVLLFPNVP
jgi:hypothetical protein